MPPEVWRAGGFPNRDGIWWYSHATGEWYRLGEGPNAYDVTSPDRAHGVDLSRPKIERECVPAFVDALDVKLAVFLCEAMLDEGVA